jgi:hypothetical protein
MEWEGDPYVCSRRRGGGLATMVKNVVVLITI